MPVVSEGGGGDAEADQRRTVDRMRGSGPGLLMLEMPSDWAAW
jgi:hypothetical protein